MAFANKQQLCDRAEKIIVNTVAHGIERATIENLADDVVSWLGRHAPRIVEDTLDGDNVSSNRLALSGLAAAKTWVAGFSRIRWIEHPLNETSRSILDPNTYELWPDPETATHIHFSSSDPASGTDNVRVSYFILHTIDDDSSTVPDHEEPAYEYGLACLSCRTKAAEFGHTTDSTLEADAVDYRAKADEWIRIADEFCKMTSRVLGVDVGATGVGAGEGGTAGTKPAWARIDWDPVTRFGQPLHRLTHGTRGR